MLPYPAPGRYKPTLPAAVILSVALSSLPLGSVAPWLESSLPLSFLPGSLATPPLAARQLPAAQSPAPHALVADPTSAGLDGERLREITSLIEGFVADGQIAGAVAGVQRQGTLAYLEAVGYQEIEGRSAMQENSLFRIYSMAKPVTSVAVMMLWEEGKFDLDDPVARHLPQFSRVRVIDGPDGATRAPRTEMTIRDLILHTSGLSHRTSALYRDLEVRRRDRPMSEFLENIVNAPLMEDPGTGYRYSEGTTVLGALVELWAGVPFDRFLEERLFRPLGMLDTGFQVRPDQLDRLAVVYGRGEGGALVPVEIEEIPFTERPALLEGAVGLVSTVPDYLRFSQMLLNRGELDGVRILRPETVDLMVANGLSPEVLAARPGTMGWGLANVNVTLDPAALNYPSSLGEYGWDGSAGTIFWNDPTTETTIVLMWQSQPANPGQLRQRIKALVHEARID